MAKSRIGMWLIGAKGGVATTAIIGVCALRKELIDSMGLVSALPRFAGVELADWNDFVIGGHDIRPGTLYAHALRMASDNRAIDGELIARCKSDIDKIDKNLRPGVLVNVGEAIEEFADPDLRTLRDTPRSAIERIQQDLREFQTKHKLAHVVVVNVASTEATTAGDDLPVRWQALNKLLDKPRLCKLPASSLYAIAAAELECSYINFTPSVGGTPAAIRELIQERGTRQAGFDGKTGETLLKSVLAPMFAARNLNVMSWVGHNIFGNLDGKVLAQSPAKKAKAAAKDRLLRPILGYTPQTLVSLEYIESLGDWKTAWDHIHFQGFFGTPMVLQFTWQGCDSLLAAPLVLDLVRFTERAWRAGNVGSLTFLGSFFKTPLDCDENDFGRQFQMLEHWADQVSRPGEAC